MPPRTFDSIGSDGSADDLTHCVISDYQQQDGHVLILCVRNVFGIYLVGDHGDSANISVAPTVENNAFVSLPTTADSARL